MTGLSNRVCVAVLPNNLSLIEKTRLLCRDWQSGRIRLSPNRFRADAQNARPCRGCRIFDLGQINLVLCSAYLYF